MNEIMCSKTVLKYMSPFHTVLLLCSSVLEIFTFTDGNFTNLTNSKLFN